MAVKPETGDLGGWARQLIAPSSNDIPSAIPVILTLALALDAARSGG